MPNCKKMKVCHCFHRLPHIFLYALRRFFKLQNTRKMIKRWRLRNIMVWFFISQKFRHMGATVLFRLLFTVSVSLFLRVMLRLLCGDRVKFEMRVEVRGKVKNYLPRSYFFKTQVIIGYFFPKATFLLVQTCNHEL